MSEISKIKLGNEIYSIKDDEVRRDIEDLDDLKLGVADLTDHTLSFVINDNSEKKYDLFTYTPPLPLHFTLGRGQTPANIKFGYLGTFVPEGTHVWTSFDNILWSEYSWDTEIQLTATNNTVYFKGVGVTDENFKFSTSGGAISVSGSISSLNNFEDEFTETQRYFALFSNCTNITDTSKLLTNAQKLNEESVISKIKLSDVAYDIKDTFAHTELDRINEEKINVSDVKSSPIIFVFDTGEERSCDFVLRNESWDVPTQEGDKLSIHQSYDAQQDGNNLIIL